MLTRTKSKTTAPAAATALPRWDDDPKIRQARELIATGEAGLPSVEQRANDLRAQFTAASSALGEATTLLGFGIGDETSLAARRAEVEALAVEAESAERQAAIIRQGLDDHRAALPRLEAVARKRVMGEMLATYAKQLARTAEAIETASAEQEVLYRMHSEICAAFPQWQEEIDGEQVMQGLGCPAPQFPELRPPQTSYDPPMANRLYRWRQSVRQFLGTPLQGE